MSGTYWLRMLIMQVYCLWHCCSTVLYRIASIDPARDLLHRWHQNCWFASDFQMEDEGWSAYLVVVINPVHLRPYLYLEPLILQLKRVFSLSSRLWVRAALARWTAVSFYFNVISCTIEQTQQLLIAQRNFHCRYKYSSTRVPVLEYSRSLFGTRVLE